MLDFGVCVADVILNVVKDLRLLQALNDKWGIEIVLYYQNMRGTKNSSHIF